jgi:trehalose-6-phosphate synthase
MNEDVRDMFGFVAPSQEQLKSISIWASKALELQAEIEQVEAHLKELNRELAQIEEVDLPRAMMSAGSEEFTMTGGGKISIDDVIQGSLAKGEEKREYAIQWVAENDGTEIIKRHFEIDYTRGQHSYAMALRKLLEENQVHFDEFESIHTSTFKAFLREKLRKNIIPPFDKMGFRFFKKAIIKPK